MAREVKHVAVDLDDVTVDFVNGMLGSYGLEFGEKVDIGEGGTWGPAMVEFFKGTDKLRAAGYKSAWDWLRDREWLWALFPAVPGAVGGVATLRAMGFYTEAVTSKPKWAEHNVWKWLGKWRVPFNQVTIIDSKAGQRKVDITDADLIIDDKLSTCKEFLDAGRSAILFDRYGSYRMSPDGDYGLWVAKDWAQVLNAVNHMTRRTA